MRHSNRLLRRIKDAIDYAIVKYVKSNKDKSIEKISNHEFDIIVFELGIYLNDKTTSIVHGPFFYYGDEDSVKPILDLMLKLEIDACIKN